MECPPDKDDMSYVSTLSLLIDPLNEDPLLEESLERVIKDLEKSGRCQRELRVLELRWGDKKLSFREIGEVIGEEEGHKCPYQRELMMQVEADARHKIGHFIRSGRLSDNLDE